MNEVLYADSDTDHFKTISDKVWILAQRPIWLQAGTINQVPLSCALRSAVRFKQAGFKIQKRVIRFIEFRPVYPQLVQTAMEASYLSSLPMALKKAVELKNGRRAVGSKGRVIEGATVWTLTPSAAQEKQLPSRSTTFALAARRLPKRIVCPIEKKIVKVVALPLDEKLFSVVANVSQANQAMAATI